MGAMTRRKILSAVAACCVAWSWTAGAASTRTVGESCYAQSKIEAPTIAEDAAIFVFIDETTELENTLEQEAIDLATGFLADGRGFTVGRFSAFIQGHYAELAVTGRIEKDLSEDQRYTLSRARIRDFDACHTQQVADVKYGLGSAMLDIMAHATAEIVRSDIMTSLQGFSQAVTASRAARKVVFVVSDMLENSSIASFYEKGGLGVVGDNVIKDAEKAQAFGDFGGAEVYVLGAAVMPIKSPQALKSYRDPRRVERLERFWTMWFSRSHAKLVAFGKPTLSVEIK